MKITRDQFRGFISKIKRPRNLIIIISIVVLILAAWCLYLRCAKGYVWADWTGFGEYRGALLKDYRGKTLWDLSELLIIPLILGLGALWFNCQAKKREIESQEKRSQTDRKIAEDRQRENTLRDYLDNMSDLLLNDRLLDKKKQGNDTVIKIAQVITVTSLRVLDTKRQNILLQFLRDAKLASFILIGVYLDNIFLSGTNLRDINLSKSSISNCDLSNAILSEAILNKATIKRSNLKKAQLDEVTMTEVRLSDVDLSDANLFAANLEKANIYRTIFNKSICANANFEEAYLGDCEMIGVNLEEASLIGASLNKLNLNEAKLFEVNLTKAFLHLVNLNNATINKANLAGAHLESAILINAFLEGANFEKANLNRALITDEQLSLAFLSRETIMPDGSKYDGRFDKTEDEDQANGGNISHKKCV